MIPPKVFFFKVRVKELHSLSIVICFSAKKPSCSTLEKAGFNHSKLMDLIQFPGLFKLHDSTFQDHFI